MKNTYKNAGVNIDAGDNLVEKIKNITNKTFTKNVLRGIGHFGAFFRADFRNYKNPVLVSSVDGVGTKIKVAIESKKFDTIGQDLVNHCVNDIAVGGAIPLFFLDYLAFGKLDVQKASEIIEGFAKACDENGLSLIGGETAEMPGVYNIEDFDIAGTIIGVVEEEKILLGKNISGGEVLLGFASNGLHTNGYSLARKVLFPKFSINYKPNELEGTLSEELLKIHKSYLNIIRRLIDENLVKAFSHITGGGIIGNTKRIIPEGKIIKINWDSWNVPPIFKFIQREGEISTEEMRKVFNMGIGLIAVTDKKNVDKIISVSNELNENVFVIGEVIR